MSCALAFVLLLTATTSVHSQRYGYEQVDSCRTPDRDIGSCVNIQSCEPLLDLLRTSSNNPNVRDFLRRSQCGQEYESPKVCCPPTADDQPADEPWRPFPDDQTGEVVDTSDFPPIFPTPGRCGNSPVSHTRIVGGTKAQLGAWPWMVVYGYIDKKDPRAPLTWQCGGALITERHTITAAHCTMHYKYKMKVARLGELNLDPNVNDGAKPVDINVTRAIRHDQYNRPKFAYDIAIVILQRPIQSFTAHISPICLPFNLKEEKFLNKNPFVAGWGAQQFDTQPGDERQRTPKELMEIQIKVWSNERCAQSYRKIGYSGITDRDLCAGGNLGPNGIKDACRGDSGGPMMQPWNGYFYIIGIVSFGHRCAEPGYPGVYARVTEYLDWIAQTVNNS